MSVAVCRKLAWFRMALSAMLALALMVVPTTGQVSAADQFEDELQAEATPLAKDPAPELPDDGVPQSEADLFDDASEPEAELDEPAAAAEGDEAADEATDEGVGEGASEAASDATQQSTGKQPVVGSGAADNLVDVACDSPGTDLAKCTDCRKCVGRSRCCCGRRPFWFGGVEATFLNADVTTGGQTTLSMDNSNTVGTDLQVVDNQALDQFTYAPRIWFGRQFNEKWGLVGRFWMLNDSSVAPPTPAPGSANQPNFMTMWDDGQVEMYTTDLEGVRSFQLGRWKIDGTCGARYASFYSETSLNAFGVFSSGNFSQLYFNSLSSFEGAGVTGSLMMRRQLGDSHWSIYLSGRGSGLGGRAVSRARESGTVTASPSPPLLGAATVSREDDEATMSIGELQAGLQWDFNLQRLPANGFARIGLEHQHWNIDSLPVGGVGFGGSVPGLTVNSFTSANHGDASLLGFAISMGFNW